ncbi:MAG: peptide ABC transporter substrate-binding protein [Acidimicrobiales bacterium]
MIRKRRGSRFLAVFVGLSMVFAACGADDDDEGAGPADDEQTTEGCATQGGEVVDLSTFAGGGTEHLDPLLSTTVSASQIGLSLYDGLTDIDFSDPENPEVVGKVAESWEVNDDATAWTFQIREGLTFSDGTPVLPSSFARAVELGSDPDFAGDYSYLYGFVEGGQEKLDGEADTVSGIEADDDAMTITYTLSAPYANFDAVAGFKVFHPMPEAREELDDQNDWETGEMIGNGAFMLDEPWGGPDADVTMVPNPEWDGTNYDAALRLPSQPCLDTVTFRVSQDEDTAFNAFEAGEGDVAQFPSGRVQQVANQYANTLDTPVVGIYYFQVNDRDPRVGGEENRLLRQAISQAIDRDEINAAVYEDTRVSATGITPPGIPGFQEGLCEFCTYDPEAAETAFNEWLAEGNELTEPIPIQLNAGFGHEPVVQIMIDNLAAVGIEAVADPRPSDDYFGQLAEGACVICRAGWILDYPTYDNFTFDLFHTSTLDGNNYGYSNPDFDALIDEAKRTTDFDAAVDLYHQAEQILLNEDVGTIPINWYRGTTAYNGDRIANLIQDPDMHIEWETVSLSG